MRQFKPKHIVKIIVAIIALVGAFFGGKTVQQQQVVNVFVDVTGSADYETTIKDVQEQLDKNKQSASNDSQTISELNNKIEELQSDNKQLQADKNALQADKNALQAEKTTLETEKGELQIQNSELQSKITEVQSQNSSLSKENDELRKKCLDNGINPDDVERSSQHAGSGVALTELVDLERNPDSYIIRGSDAATKDDEGTNYPYGISCRAYDERSIEYRLDGKYRYLSGTLFVTAYGAGSYTGNRWDKMSFVIYADDREIFPGDTYARPAYGKQMEAIKISDLDIEGVKRIKFVFNNASADWNSSPLICFGVPRVYE